VAIVVVACVANYWLFIPAAIVVAVQLLFRWFFLHTSRHIKRLEALGKLTQCFVYIARINAGFALRAFFLTHFYVPL